MRVTKCMSKCLRKTRVQQCKRLRTWWIIINKSTMDIVNVKIRLNYTVSTQSIGHDYQLSVILLMFTINMRFEKKTISLSLSSQTTDRRSYVVRHFSESQQSIKM